MPLEGSITPAGGTSPSVASTPGSTIITSLGGAEAPPTPPPAAPVETKPAETPPAPTKPPEVESWRLAALSQKEKAAREAAAQAKADREAAAQERAAANQLREEMRQREAMYRQDPMRLLQDHGFDYDSVTRFVAQGGWSPEQQQAAREAARDQAIRELARQQQADREALQKQREADAQAAREREEQTQAQAREQAVVEFKQEISDFVNAEPDTYEMVRLAGPNAIEQVFARIEEHFEKTGQRLPTKDAAEQVEAALVAEAEKIIEASKKLRSKFAPPPPPPGPAARTLSNDLKPTPAAAPPGGRQETEAERRARVTAAIEKAWGHR